MTLSRIRRGAIALALITGAATLNAAPANALTRVNDCPDYYSVWLQFNDSDNYCYTDPGFTALNLVGLNFFAAENWGGHLWYDYNQNSMYFSPGQVNYFLYNQVSALRIY
jgi:hypothetical protein